MLYLSKLSELVFNRKYDKYPFVGIYKVLTPALLIRDPELIKEVVLKNFSNFYDNSITFHEGDPLIGRNPFVLKGQKWKTFRNQLTPLFTSAKVALFRQVALFLSTRFVGKICTCNFQ